MRDCENCIYSGKDGCVKWECEFVSKEEARRIVSESKAETEIRTEESTEYFKKSEVLEMLEKINKSVEDGEGYQHKEWVDYVAELPAIPQTDSVLEDIKAEIIKNIENTKDYEDEALFNGGLKFALEIIDKHIGGKENE